ncbi:MAG: helix-turn-helix domain-containing protein [Heliobacteriaceae bacterium]|jgi:transcriptional regulator with XRE-family HTH domain|nr:helix-turn-helix domain-containing protein [Heliobacteriaceae bacterium]
MSQDVRKILAINVSKYRIQSGYTKEELSLKLEFDNSYISKLENKRINITVDKLTKIADALDVHVKDLFDFD